MSSCGTVEHGDGPCVHPVVRVRGRSVEFVTHCGGRISFGLPATVTVPESMFAEGAVVFNVAGKNEVASYRPAHRPTEKRAARPRKKRAARPREEQPVRWGEVEPRTPEEAQIAARHFEAVVDFYLNQLREPALSQYAPRVAAMIESIRQGTPGRSFEDWFADWSALLRAMGDTLFGTFPSAPPLRPLPSSPWFVTALGLPAWPCAPADVRRAFAALALRTHPDHGGTAAAFMEAKRARDEALEGLGA